MNKLMKKVFLIWTALIALGSVKAFAIIGGEVAPENPRSGVINIYMEDPIQGTSSLCTASKISDTVLLTAAHCFNEIAGFAGGIGFSHSIHNPDLEFSAIKVTGVKKHPSYRGDGLMKLSKNDVALIFVEPTPEFKMLEILEISYENVPSNQVIEFWGYGCQKPMKEEDELEDITKKFARTLSLNQKTLLDIGGNFPTILRDLSESIYQSKFITAANNMDHSYPSLCDGDSGGPAMVNGKIVGVNSF